jgi:hypothetical protein
MFLLWSVDADALNWVSLFLKESFLFKLKKKKILKFTFAHKKTCGMGQTTSR